MDLYFKNTLINFKKIFDYDSSAGRPFTLDEFRKLNKETDYAFIFYVSENNNEVVYGVIINNILFNCFEINDEKYKLEDNGDLNMIFYKFNDEIMYNIDYDYENDRIINMYSIKTGEYIPITDKLSNLIRHKIKLIDMFKTGEGIKKFGIVAYDSKDFIKGLMGNDDFMVEKSKC